MKNKLRKRLAVLGIFTLFFALSTSAELEFLGSYSHGFVRSVATYGDTIYYGSSGTLMVVHLDDHGQLVTVEEIAFPAIIDSIVRHDNYLFVERMFDHIRVFDLSSPNSLQVLGDISEFSLYQSTITGDLLIGWFSDSNESGIKIINLKNGPLPPLELSRIDTADHGHGSIVVAGTTLYYSISGQGSTDDLIAVDLSDPKDPRWLSTLEGLPEITQIRSLGNYLYMSSWTEGLLVMDITEPSQPTLVETVPAGLGAYFSSDSYRGVLLGDDKISTLGLSDLSKPTILQTANLPETADGVLLSGIRAYDLSYPLIPSDIGVLGYLIGATSAAENGKIYLDSGWGGLFIFRDLASLAFSDGFESGDLSQWSSSQP